MTITMTSSNSPSTHWRRQHGQKVWHQYREEAQRHADELNAKWLAEDGSKSPWQAYPCRWGGHYKYGPVAVEHWHVGRGKQRTNEEDKGHGMAS